MAKHLLFVALFGHGHVNPTLPLVEELIRRGHRVDYATSAEHAEAVTRAGARWVELPPIAPIDPPTEFGPEVFGTFLRHVFAGMRAAYPVLRDHCATERVDAVCYDAMNWSARVVAEQLGIPAVQCLPHFAGNEHFSLFAEFTHGPGGENVFAKALGPDCAEFAAEFGVELDPAQMDVTEKLNLVFIPREFQPAGDTFDERYHFIGPSVGSRADEEWSPPDADKPVLFISLGTVFNDRPEFYRTCLEAFGDGAYHVAMTVGGVDPDALGPIPECFDIRSRFPQPAVLRRAAAFVSHTGMNSTMEALYYGVGLVAVPQMPEQAANAERARELGLGERLDARTLTAESLRAAVDRVASGAEVRANLDRMREVVRSSGGAVRGADLIEEYLGG
ncbi:glycosyl transferase [Streptomyces sp. NRRL F-4489]|uniref:macrolide family glycosyltransferase n=1 Tax=Streptomyces sp. NRRL F-4489 TaxID=1609095 RepID=UPI00074AD7D4|nr:macrolide family glycosyltransferase [Streptomyces sp. NRRL F-4489]KUL38834.1 glycosyl transferase [Streptomyces sp. NRRL F-4489]